MFKNGITSQILFICIYSIIKQDLIKYTIFIRRLNKSIKWGNLKLNTNQDNIYKRSKSVKIREL